MVMVCSTIILQRPKTRPSAVIKAACCQNPARPWPVPEEIMLMILEQIDSKQTFWVISLACRTLNRLVAKYLYKKVTLGPLSSLHPAAYKAKLFRRTLIEDTELGHLTKNLTVTATNKDTCPPLAISFQDAVPMMMPDSSDLALLGHVISRLPNLEYLCLRLWIKGVLLPTEREPGISDLWPTTLSNPQALNKIPALTNLKVLVLEDMLIDWTWLTLPNLKHVAIGNGCDPEQSVNSFVPGEKTPVPSLRLAIPAWIIVRNNDGQYAYLENQVLDNWIPRLLARFSNLRRLGLTLHEEMYFTDEQKEEKWWYADWDWLMLALTKVEPGLESLHLDVETKELSYLQHIVPVTHLNSLSNLRVLELSECALLGASYPNGAPVISQQLPSSLEKLDIWYPSQRILHWMEYLLVEKRHFPCLKAVRLKCCPELWGLTTEKFGLTKKTHSIWGRLWIAGVKVAIIDEDGEKGGFDEVKWEGRGGRAVN